MPQPFVATERAVQTRDSRGWLGLMAAIVAGCAEAAPSTVFDAGDLDLGSFDVVSTGEVGARDSGTDVAVDAPTGTDVRSDDAPADAGVVDVPVVDGSTVDAAVVDASVTDSPDAGSVDVAPVDAGALDSGSVSDVPADVRADVPAVDVPVVVDVVAVDAPGSDAVATDVAAADAASPRGTPVIDGVIGADWPAGALSETNTVVSTWNPALNALSSIRVAWDATRLYLGIRGTVEATNAILVFIDRDYVAGSTATGVTSIASLTDGVGSLDNAVSCNVTEMPVGFGVDMVWGTRGMQTKAAADLIDNVGLRNVSCSGCAGNFNWVAGDVVACVGGATPACEVSIPWTALYGGAAPPVPSLGLFVRITNMDGSDLSNNQCLPQQASGDAPTVARRVLAFRP